MREKATYAVRTAQTGSNGWGISDELAHTLDTTGPEAVVHVLKTRVHQNDDILAADTGESVSEYTVRRLTPVETERLQGFPDGWTDLSGCDVDAVTDRVAASLGYDESQRAALRKKVAKWSTETPDGTRYKATGNSFAVPVVRWIGERIAMAQSVIDEMGEA